ncbi:hypothetical protein AJ81_10150 [Pseudothermotoga hypogea DSM 11164 = NBRC 106472]|uniref:Uncharacterized protein n=1 Tax=Pseudothermotoga hypogea DSM 11164 = NBRC 106472 TaxID=1123384 RepID=A0A0X1KUE0_9THEM|nr:hypothetical protein AJ81_10150 [Pseudothermotoga hypogea DSM 11164 = NBRC 106472]
MITIIDLFRHGRYPIQHRSSDETEEILRQFLELI